MSSSVEHRTANLIAEIQDLVCKSLDSGDSAALEQARSFVPHYFGDVDPEEFLGRAAAGWCGIALAHMEFGRQFRSGAAKLRVFNPQPGEGGGSAATVVECINDDMPFLVDSVCMEISRQGGAAQLVLHPLFSTERDAGGFCLHLAPALGAGQGPRPREATQESWMRIELQRISDPERLQALEQGLAVVLADVRAVVDDWPQMSAKVGEIVAGMGAATKAVPLEEIDTVRAFLTWLSDNHFTFQGYREYEFAQVSGEDQLNIVANSGLGVLREPRQGVSAGFRELPPAIRALARQPQLLVLTKATARATVHRPGYLDYVGVKRFDPEGRVIGEHRFVGLYTSSAYHASPQQVPLLRQKLARTLERAGFPAQSHAGKTLVSIFENLPRDELLAIGDEDLYATVMGILRLGERARTRLFVRRDDYSHLYSCLIFLPRESYNTQTRVKLQDILKRSFRGNSVEFNLQLSDSILARVHMLVRTDPGAHAAVDLKALEAEIAAAVRPWEEGVFERLAGRLGEDAANGVMRQFVLPLPAAYREDVGAEQAVADLLSCGTLTEAEPLAMSLYQPQGAGKTAGGAALRFRLYRLGAAVPLSGSMPMLENMGVEVDSELSYVIERRAAAAIYIHDFGLLHRYEGVDFAEVRPKFEQAFARIWKRQVENDGFNRLTLAASLASDEIVMLRTYAKYLKQAGFTYSQSYIEQTLARHAGITRSLVGLFQSRFDPALASDRAATIATGAAAVEAALESVASADEDRILRRFLAAVQASLRTNYYQRDGQGSRKSYLSIKLDSALVPELPDPRPLYEIFVYSPRVEGIHLRGGKVARGGLRWSDRPEDFRTEVLGLVKAQMVKNAVIVPVGSKGGFVLKSAPPASEREAYMEEGVACYRIFLRGLLDLTDNLLQGRVVPPVDVVRHDADDTYLVVAADKGTASFSDYANAVAAEYGYWLGDAFASGGSAGYDHKKMAITARGAWESVKRHFRELGVDTQSLNFSVVGIGDMSGDVFGNGMLLSKHILLVAAFDHRHIFLDPQPDPAASYDERARLFALPRSSWDDYDRKLISAGGGVFRRDAKSIALSPEVRSLLAVDAETMTPVQLMRAILMAPVDLFYNGGIGTYVKASRQSHAAVGDRANDALRVDGRDLRCKVVAEGGNLGFTQLGRVEYAQAGGLINSDAIDNSAGVDCSDHEVNIKILLNAAIESGALTPDERNPLLAAMTEEIGQLVLRDNYYQTQSLAVSGVRGEKMLDAQERFIRHLERVGRLNRAVEYLPSDDEIAERKAKKCGLTAPERAVLLAYSKMELYEDLLGSTLIDDPYVALALKAYFPAPLQSRFAEIMPRHPLKREIIATEVANSTINRTGSVFVHRMREETGASAEQVVRAYILAREVFALENLWRAIDVLDGKVPAAIQSKLFIDSGRLALRATLWFLRRGADATPIVELVYAYAAGVAEVAANLHGSLAPADHEALSAVETGLVASGVPAPTAAAIAYADVIFAALDIIDSAQEVQRPVPLAAAVYFGLGGSLELRRVALQIGSLPADNHWQASARAAMRDDLALLQRQLSCGVLAASPQLSDAAALLAAWRSQNDKALARLAEVMADLEAAREADLAMLSVLLRELRLLA